MGITPGREWGSDDMPPKEVLVWAKTLSSWLVGQGYVPMKSDNCVFIKSTPRGFVIFVLYVDDVLMFGDSDAMQEETLAALHAAFDMEDKGEVQYYVGINVQAGGGSSLWTKGK